jgi:hypothetical protein
MLLLALWGVAAATGESPVAKVVAVLAELKAKQRQMVGRS